MSAIKSAIKRHVTDAKLMQIATISDEKPWICSVYFVCDTDLNLYWLSYPTRRHSQDIAQNHHVAIAVAVKDDIPVVGVQAEGTAEKIDSFAVATKVLPRYIKKYGAGKQFLQNLKLHKNKHVLYKFTPNRIVLFDEKTFGSQESQEILLNQD